MIWAILQAVGKQGITFIMFSILALLLDPRDFGILGMAMALIAFIQVFSEIGFGAALIQRQNITSKHFNTVFYMNIGIGAFLTLIGVILARPCAFFFHTPEVRPVVTALSFGFILNAFSLTQIALLQREMKFRELAIRDILAALIGGIVGITLAWFKFGVWSLIFQSLTTYFIGSLLMWHLAQWEFRINEFSFQCLKDMWKYSSKIFSFQIFKYFAQNTDKLIVGHFLGPIALGLYTFAFKLVVYPINTLIGAIGMYLFPKFSRMQSNLSQVKLSYLLISKAINSVVVPLLLAIAVLSPLMIYRFFGYRWIQAAPLIQIFTLLALIQPMISLTGQLMKALNRPSWLLIWSACIAVFTSIFLGVGTYFKGVTGAACGITVAYIIGFPINLWFLRKLVQIRWREILNLFIPSTLSSISVCLALLLIINSKASLDNTRIFVTIFCSIIFYLLNLALFDRLFMLTVYRRLIKI